MTLEISEEYLVDLVKGLSPSKELFAGKRFLEIHLREKGVEATIAFVNKIIDILDDEEGLNKDIDFDEDELIILKRAKFNHFDRRNFLRVGAWAACGIPIAIYGATRTAENMGEYVNILESDREKADGSSQICDINHFIGKHFMPPAEIICGAALTYEAIDKHNILKLQQVARAVTKFADKIAEKHQGVIIQP